MSADRQPLVRDASKILANFASQIQYADIPHDVIERMKMCVLDSIGCCLHGVTLPWTKTVEAMVMDEGSAPAASIFGTTHKTSLGNAALVNGTAGHAFEFDDMHKESILHPGSIAIPVLFALVEKLGRVSGKDFLTAMVSGYEIGARVGNAASIQLFFDGFHPQGTSGVFVGAAAAGRPPARRRRCGAALRLPAPPVAALDAHARHHDQDRVRRRTHRQCRSGNGGAPDSPVRRTEPAGHHGADRHP